MKNNPYQKNKKNKSILSIMSIIEQSLSSIYKVPVCVLPHKMAVSLGF